MLSKVFKAYDVRAIYPDPLGETEAWKIGVAAGRFFADHPEKPGGKRSNTVAVSRDMRPSAPAMAKALIDGLRAGGVDVVDLGMCDTSIQYFAVPHLDCAGGIQVTASHNPVEYIGFKFSGPQAKPIGADSGLKDIQAIAETIGNPGTIEPTGEYEEMDLWDAYREHVLKFLEPLQREVTVFVDASNGMAGKLVPKVFDNIPNLKIIPLNFEITGSFVHEPNPLKAENMVYTQQGVKDHGADFGACFDGDADRCMLVDDKGENIGCDHLTALFCDHFVPMNPGTTVVFDLRSSKVVEEKIAETGATPRKGRVGHVFMKATLRETGAAFGGELSGHFYFKQNNCCDSGAIAFAVVLSILGKTDRSLSELIDPLRKYPQSGEINFEVEDKEGVMKSLASEYGDDGETDWLDGVSADCWEKRGFWFNVRPSNTEPLLRLNAEAKDQSTLDALLEELQPKLGKPAEGH